MSVLVYVAQKKIMTLTLKTNRRYQKGAILLLVVWSALFLPVQAQSEISQTLSVSPTLFQMTATPEQTWRSEIRVINVNNYDITVFPQVVNFAPKGESGQGDFLPVFSSETDGQTLAEWIDLSVDGVLIPKQQTVTIPFTISVPKEAAPGGHYAAILIGTKPSTAPGSESMVQTAQFVTSLFFVRVAGDVVEAGSVREFRTTQTLYQKPDIAFEVRFENLGNVHLQPQGEIKIVNMWGQERGIIPINHQTHFGNVLPNSIRKFNFSWKSEETSFDIGRYKAVVTLGYGDNAKNFVTSSAYFWIVPYKQILIFVLFASAFIWFFSFAVKMYVRRMLALSGITMHAAPTAAVVTNPVTKNSYIETESKHTNTVHVSRYHIVTEPVRSSMQDLKDRLRETNTFREVTIIFVKFILSYRLFFIAVVVLLVTAVCARAIWSRVSAPARPYEVVIGNPDAPLTITSEAIYYDNLKSQTKPVPNTIVPEYADTKLALVNVSGVVGTAAALRLALETDGYFVSTLSSDANRADEKTAILYNVEQKEAALALSKRLGGALLSVDPAASRNLLTVYVGADQKQ